MKDKARKVAAGASVALATSGLSTCNDNGAVDPPPPPLECNTVDEGESLTATATVAGTALQVSIRNGSPSSWSAVAVTAVVGGTARPVTPAEPLVVVIDLTDDRVSEGSFRLTGELRGSTGNRCAVSRTFTFRLQAGGVVVASAKELPLAARQQARITLVGRDGREVQLEATTPFRGAAALAWTVTGGEVVSRKGARLHWRLPPEPGLYQAELVIDYGPSGLSFDTLVLEVS
jgi:hypothetical protein